MRVVLLALALALLGTACGDRLVVDPLAALEKDPDGILTLAQPTYQATYETYMTWLTVYRGVPYPTTVRHMTTVVYAARPPDHRWDVTYADANVPTTENVLVHAQSAEYCSNNPGPAACYVLEPELGEFWVRAITDSPWEGYRKVIRDMNVTVLPRERIASREGACFRWTTRGPLPTRTIDDAFEGCFTADGLMLRAMMDLGDTRTEFRAVSVGDRVTDADLALPYAMKAGPLPIPSGGPPPQQTVAPTPKH
jgi:hypothetical protein